MKSRFLRVCSLVLVLVLLANMLPMQILAEEYRETLSTATAEETQPISADSTAHIVDEIEEKRTEFTKEFTLSNGLHMAAVYPDAVHYETATGWAEIDNTLKAQSDGTYSNTAGVWDVRFPQQLSGAKSVVIQKDGYTLSFAMAGQLRSGGLSMSTQEMELSQMQQSNATVMPTDVDALQASFQYAQMAPDKLYSRLTYADVYPNTDIVYDLDANRVKESIVMDAYSSTLRGYSYTLDVGQLIPVLEENGQITFYDEKQEQVIMVMPAPYMVDAANVFSGDVQVQLVGKGSTYVLTYLVPQQWLAAEDRAWPVILDPVVTANVAATNIEDKTVCENETPSYKWSILDAGYSTSRGKIRSFLKYVSLPALTSSDVVVGAEFSLYKVENADTSSPVEVHKVTGTWDSQTVTWATQPAFESNADDYAIVKNAGRYYWIVTDIVRDWYATGNNGLMIKLSNAIENGGTKNFRQFYSSDYGVAGSKPTLAIMFRNNNGLESYWDYTSSSAGRAGTGYINNFTGNLVLIRDDLSITGNRMPVTIQHVYNANDAAHNNFGMGYGWRSNYNQRVYQWSENSSYYVWEDSDGTRHYFEYDSANTYKDEDDLELTLTTNGSTSEPYCIADKNGNQSYFDNYGRLIRMENNQQTESTITITYASAKWYPISKITDGAGRVYQFYYDSAGMNKYIGYRAYGSTVLNGLTPTYENNRLVSIQNRDGSYTNYRYNSAGLLTEAEDSDGYKLTYTYNTVSQTWQPYRVQSVTEYDGNVQGGGLTIQYAHNQTTFTDHAGNVEIHQFNDFGNTVSIQDDEGRATYAQYAKNNYQNTTEKGNQLKLSSKLQNTVGNRFKDGSFENGTVWSPNGSTVTTSVTTETAYYGSKSQKIVNTTYTLNNTAYSNNFAVAPGETVTASAYLKNPDAVTSLEMHYYDSATGTYPNVSSPTLPASQDWQRAEVTFTNSGSEQLLVYVHVRVENPGTYYVDCVQVEKATTASRYNLIENGDFWNGEYGWTRGAYFESTETCTTAEESPAPQLDNRCYKIIGTTDKSKHLWQYVRISGNAGDTYVLSGWAKADSVPYGDSTTRQFSLVVFFTNTDGTQTKRVIRFNPDTDSENNWQYLSGVVIADKPYQYLSVDCQYDFNLNTAYFDGIQLYKEEFGNSYTYDNDGNVIAVKDLQKQTTTYEYTNNNLTKEILPTGAELTYTYDNYHNVTSATTEEGLTYNFTYDGWGNNTSVSITANGKTMTSTATYSTDGNRLVSTTDALGKVTKYGYNEITNVLDWVQYPEDTDGTEGTADTRTKYTYDSMYRMATAACTTDTGKNLSAAYTYTDDYLTAVQTPSTTYSFTYGDFGLRTGVSIGDRTLATYNYTDDRNNYLESLDYGNDDSVEYTYDKKGRVTSETYEDGDTVTYKYDNDGALAKVTDSATGRTTTYYYDFTDRLMKQVESGTGYSHAVGYQYDTINNLTQMVETINGVDHTTSYTYDDDNRVESVTTDGVTVEYTYDALGRVTMQDTINDVGSFMRECFTYTNPAGNTTSSQVATCNISTPNNYSVTYTYTYDDNGNITSISNGTNTTSYVYDSANQLIRENNQAGGYTHTWTYDDAGNILSRKEYAYTLESLAEVTPTDTDTYIYGDAHWGDLLTEYDGNDVEYDEIGNLVYDGNWDYTWEHGRQLKSMSAGDTTWTYTYDANGMRTKRTNGTTTYEYIYNGSQLTQMTVDGYTFNFTYDANGTPLTISLGSSVFYYMTNLQGDVIGLFNSDCNLLATYTYDAWGVCPGHEDDPTAFYNPLRYRGYVYDQETGLYYVSSRYYDPEIGRWINADNQIAGVGGEVLGYNMFAYCMNNPVNMFDPTGNWPSWSNLLKGSAWLAVGITAVCVGVSVLTCGVAAPAMVAVAAVTVGAGALTAVNGAAEIGEAFTGYNVVRDTVFSGNQKAYDAYANTTAAVAEVGTAVCGGWMAKNSPRINAYKSMDSYNVKNKHLSSGSGDWSKFNTTSQAELRALGREALKNTPMSSLVPNSADSYAAIYNFGRVIGTSGQTSARLVFSTAGKIITFFPQ